MAGEGKGYRETDAVDGQKEPLGAGWGQAQVRVLTLEAAQPGGDGVSSLC